MQKSIKKVLVIVPMIFMLCMSFIGTAAKAEDKVNQTTTVESGSKGQDNNNQNKTDAAGVNSANSTNGTSANVAANTNGGAVSGTDTTGKNPSNVNSATAQNAQTATQEILPAWKNINGKFYYVTKDGITKKTGWFKEKDVNPNANNDNIYYLDNNSAVTIGWKQIDKQWYYFNGVGIKQTGWQLINYNWYYLGKDGMMQKGWINDQGYRYYLNDEGAMTSGKKYIDGKWYFFASDGKLQTGFYSNEGKPYYSTNDGEMVANQWIKTNINKYYVKADSGLATGYAIIDNVAENFDSYGKYIGPADMKDHLFVKHLNVGDADCAFLKLPSGETVLIDTGTPATSEKLINFLKDQNLKKEDGKEVIDYVIITHAHSDHIGGLASILNVFKIGKVYMPDIAKMQDWYSDVKVTAENQSTVDMMKTDFEVYNDAARAMKLNNMKFNIPKKGDFIDKDRILQFVESDKNYGGIGSDKISQYYWGINENSAIVYLNYGDLQELFTADMEWNSEKDFWTNNLLNGRKVDLLKVPHHGNDTSSTPDFIRYLHPSVGVISRAKESVKQNTAYNNLISNGVSIYETSAKDEGISIYATPENWTLQQN